MAELVIHEFWVRALKYEVKQRLLHWTNGEMSSHLAYARHESNGVNISMIYLIHIRTTNVPRTSELSGVELQSFYSSTVLGDFVQALT